MRKLFYPLIFTVFSVTGCAALLESTSKITTEQVTTVLSSETPFAETLKVLGEIGACDAITEVALGAPEDLQTPETGTAAVATCNNFINAGAQLIPVNSVINPDGSTPTKLQVACRNPFMLNDYIVDPTFATLVEVSCSTPPG